MQVQELDVADLASVRQFADNWLQSKRKLDCLINNAGIFSMGGTVHWPAHKRAFVMQRYGCL